LEVVPNFHIPFVFHFIIWWIFMTVSNHMLFKCVCLKSLRVSLIMLYGVNVCFNVKVCILGRQQCSSGLDYCDDLMFEGVVLISCSFVSWAILPSVCYCCECCFMTIYVVDEIVFWFTVHLEIPYWICSLLCLVLFILVSWSKPWRRKKFWKFWLYFDSC